MWFFVLDYVHYLFIVIIINSLVWSRFEMCQNCRSKKWWASSRVAGGRYIVKQKVINVNNVIIIAVSRCVHGFTCAGIIPRQYTHSVVLEMLAKIISNQVNL